MGLAENAINRVRGHLSDCWQQAQRYHDGEAISVNGSNGRFVAAQRGQLGLQTVLAAFTVVIAAMVIVVVLDEFDQTTISNGSSTLSNESLNDSKGSLLSGFASMVSLIEPLLLIGIGVVIISLIQRVG